MRFMVIVKANKDSEAGVMPTQKELADMGNFNETLIERGAMLAGEGLLASSRGAKIKFEKNGGHKVTDGPFAESKEHLAGFFLVECESFERALAIASRVPEADLGLVEVRPTMSLSGFEM